MTDAAQIGMCWHVPHSSPSLIAKDYCRNPADDVLIGRSARPKCALWKISRDCLKGLIRAQELLLESSEYAPSRSVNKHRRTIRSDDGGCGSYQELVFTGANLECGRTELSANSVKRPSEVKSSQSARVVAVASKHGGYVVAAALFDFTWDHTLTVTIGLRSVQSKACNLHK